LNTNLTAVVGRRNAAHRGSRKTDEVAPEYGRAARSVPVLPTLIQFTYIRPISWSSFPSILFHDSTIYFRWFVTQWRHQIFLSAGATDLIGGPVAKQNSPYLSGGNPRVIVVTNNNYKLIKNEGHCRVSSSAVYYWVKYPTICYKYWKKYYIT